MERPIYEIPLTDPEAPPLGVPGSAGVLSAPDAVAPVPPAGGIVAAPMTYEQAPPPGFTPAPAPLLPPPAPTPAELGIPRIGEARSEAPLFVDDEWTRLAREKADPELLAAMEHVVREGGSDLHVSANTPPLARIDGALRPIPGYELWDRERVAAALHSLLTDEQRQKFEVELELDFAFTLSENARFRVNYYLQRGAIGAALRLIPTEIRRLSDLGVPEIVGRFADRPRGLVLVTGPTGSGKSTTLAALIDLVNRTRTDHIVTVEDPIEYLHRNRKGLVNQREVGEDTHSFAAALKHVLRQDPDVILIGELRDHETISVALTAAETGHLVFATLHTQDAPQSIDRIIDVFPPHQQGQIRSQLASTLIGVVSQTLIKRAQGGGRVIATEILVMTPAIANLVREGKTYQIVSAMQAGRDLGMHTMDQHLADLVNAGTITHSAAREKVHDLAGFDRLVHRADPAAEQAMAGGIDFGDAYSRGV